MKNNIKLVAGITLSLLFTGCAGTSTSSFAGYVDLQTAMTNTTYYALNYNSEYNHYVEIYLDDFYYNDFQRQGFLILDSDPDWLHNFSTVNEDPSSLNPTMYIYGRNAPKENISQFESSTLLNILSFYQTSFVKTSENVWSANSTVLCGEISDFLQSKLYSYSNCIDLTIGQDNRLEKIDICEVYNTQKSVIGSYLFEDIDDYKNLDMYQKWVDKGSEVNERIYDYKMLYTSGFNQRSVYNGEEVNFTATITAIDAEGDLYVANEDSLVGNVGIRVESENRNVNVGDIVNVKGMIRTSAPNVYVSNAEVTDTGNDAPYLPIFDEERIVDSSGGGIYAAQIFSLYPFFNDSIYSTYAYVSDIPNSLDTIGDTNIELICPTQLNSEEEVYGMQIVIPFTLQDNIKNTLFNNLKDASIYGNDGAYELSLENFIIRFDGTYKNRIKLIANSLSVVSKRLNAQEKIEKNIGISGFPIIPGLDVISFKFGGSTGAFLETFFGLEENDTTGVYVTYQSLKLVDYQWFIRKIEEYGAIKQDVIKDIYGSKHQIYKYGETYIDFMYYEGDEMISSSTLQIWIYNGDLVRGLNITEKLDALIGDWFDTDNFLKYENSFDADYEVYKLYDYAGNSFSEDEPLICVAYDSQEKVFDDYNKTLISMGYSQYRNENGRAYSYKARGQTHYIFTKDNVFVDVASYHTSDYTYLGHNEFEYRLEVLIYQGDKPLEVTTYDNLDILSNLYAEIDPSLAYDINLPSGCKVEIWKDLNNYKLANVDYGYGGRDEAFIYTESIDEVCQIIDEAILAAGFNKIRTYDNSILYSKNVENMSYGFFVLKEADKGYVRVMNDIGGLSFYR